MEEKIAKMRSKGIKVERVKKPLISKAEYKQLEFNTSDIPIEKPNSADYHALMHLAVHTEDKVWFDELAILRNYLVKLESK